MIQTQPCWFSVLYQIYIFVNCQLKFVWYLSEYDTNRIRYWVIILINETMLR